MQVRQTCMEGSETHTALHYLHYKACTFVSNSCAVSKPMLQMHLVNICNCFNAAQYTVQKKDPACGSFKGYLWRR
ncbi:hypothetical protein B9T34_09890 [Acinetobacter sp. ANC 3813]|nr:hypothetical protein B9T34_09890 [Acinetobacter sp. ANC 3813]